MYARLLRRFDSSQLPDGIYRQLVRDLYGPMRSAIAGALAPALVGAFISWRTHSLTLAVLTAALASIAVARLTLLHAFKVEGVAIEDVRQLRGWELRYLVATSMFTACVGALCFAAVLFTDDAVSHMLMVTLAAGYATGITLRSSSRPAVALLQLLLVIGPILAAGILRFEGAYGVLAVICVLYLMAMSDIAGHQAQARLNLLETAAQVHYLSTHDDLTGLPNRMFLRQTLAGAASPGREFALLFIDLDRFKIINDTLGHAAGDELLIDLTVRLKRCLPGAATLARVGGDEFVVLLHDAADRAEVAATARQLLAAAASPVVIQGQECQVTTSIGIAMFPADATDDELLVKRADAAMYAAKEQGRNAVCFYSEGVANQSVQRLALESSLRRALERNELVLHYQVQQNLADDSIVGVEALLRWQHPDLGLLPPSQFIPIAEETGLIVPIGRWVLETACLQNMRWQADGLPPMQIAVNVSPRQFADPHLLRVVSDALAQSGMAAELLELEITESMVVKNPPKALKVLTAIRQVGVHVAIDDFGTGYSSMSLLRDFPVDTLKIDRSFFREIPDNHSAKAIVEAIIAMGRALNLNVVAEGVETPDQKAFLLAHNCTRGQGYLISRPMPREEFAAFLMKQTSARMKQSVPGRAQDRARLKTAG